MQIISQFAPLPLAQPAKGTAVAMGYFDGIHIGHRAVGIPSFFKILLQFCLNTGFYIITQDRDAVVHDTRTYFNVFGESKNDSSFICMLEDGVPYASIQADISGRSHSYNYVNAVYSVLHREQYDVSDRSTQSMFVYEDGTAEGEGIVQR